MKLKTLLKHIKVTPARHPPSPLLQKMMKNFLLKTDKIKKIEEEKGKEKRQKRVKKAGRRVKKKPTVIKKREEAESKIKGLKSKASKLEGKIDDIKEEAPKALKLKTKIDNGLGKIKELEQKIKKRKKEGFTKKEWRDFLKKIEEFSELLKNISRKIEKIKEKIKKPKKIKIKEEKELKQTNKWYPLIEINGKNFAWANVRWSSKEESLIYYILEPPITSKEEEQIEEIKDLLEEKLDIDFSALGKSKAKKYIKEKLMSTIDELELDINERELDVIKYYIMRDFVGLNEIEPLMKDSQIEDISCDGVNLPLYIVHRNPSYGGLKTNVMFSDTERLSSFVMKIAQRCGKSISVAAPLLDGSLPDGSVDWKSRIIYQDEGEIKTEEIGKLVDKYYEKEESNKPKPVNGLRVPVFNSDYEMEWKNVDYVYRHKNKEKLYKIKTEFGREVNLTGAHSIFTLENGKVEATKVLDLEEEDWVVIPKKIPKPENEIRKINLAKKLSETEYSKKLWLKVPEEVFQRESEKILNYLEEHYKNPKSSYREFKEKYGKIIPLELYNVLKKGEIKKSKIKTNSPVTVSAVIDISPELLRILGYYIAEGWTRTTEHHLIEFSFNKKEKNLIQDLRSSFRKVFSVNTRLEPDKNAVKVIVDGLVPWLVFKEVFKVKKGAGNKEVPPLVFNVSRDLQKEFFKAWWDGDYGYTISRKLAEDLQYLKLFNENIISFNKRRRISEIAGRKVESKCYYTQHLGKKEGLTYPKMVPLQKFNPLPSVHAEFKRNERYGRKRIEKILADNRFRRFEGLKKGRRDFPEQFFWQWKKRGIISENGELTERGERALEELKRLEKVNNSDLAFVKIEKIERVEPSSLYVYDISVKGNENFISGFGGICCHNSRVQATLGTDIARRGSNFTIRKFTEKPMSPIDIQQYGTLNTKMLAYFWNMIENQKSFLIAGTVATGKTTLLNSLGMFIKPELKIISIEETPELRFVHENWIPQVTRMGYGPPGEGGKKYGEVTMYELLKSSLRQRPDYLLVGEVRGREASVMFQALSTGHPGLSTLHADVLEKVVDRLTTRPISLPASLLDNLDVIVFLTRVKRGEKYIRRVKQVIEVLEYNIEKQKLETNLLFKWNPKEDNFEKVNESIMLKKISEDIGIPMEEIKEEIEIKKAILDWMVSNEISNYKKVTRLINQYYEDKNKLLRKIR